MDRIIKLKEFLRKTPADSFLQHALALEYVKLGDDETARIQFQQLLVQNPGYIGSYYHLGKLYERIGLNEEAIKTYETGMAEAQKAGDLHALGELRAAFEDLTY